MSTLNIDFPKLEPSPVDADGLNRYQQRNLGFWLLHYSTQYETDRKLILKAIAIDPRMLDWASWPMMLTFGKYLTSIGV